MTLTIFYHWVIRAIVFTFLFFPVSALADKRNDLLKAYKKAERLYNLDNPSESSDLEAIKIFNQVGEAGEIIPSQIRIKSFLNAGNIHQGYNRFNESKLLYHKALQLIGQNGNNQSFLYEARLYLGTAMYFTGILDSARYYFEKASEIASVEKLANNLPERDRLYNSLGVIYYESGNYQQAKNYFQTALNFISADSDDYGDFYNNIQSNTANCLLKLKYFDSSLNIFRKLKQANPQNNLVLQNLAHAYLENNQIDSSWLVYQSFTLPEGFGKIIGLNDIGRIFLKKGEIKTAENYFTQAIEENKKLTGNVKNKEEALSYLYRGQLAFQSGLLNESLVWINRGLSEVHLTYSGKNLYDYPNDISNTISPVTLYEILVYKAFLVYQKYLTEYEEVYLFKACKIYLKAVELFRFILRNFDNDDARTFFIENNRSLFNDAVRIVYEASLKNKAYLEDALMIIESYKGNVLQQSLYEAGMQYDENIPLNLKSRLNLLKQLYAAYLTQLNQTVSESESEDINRKIAGIQVELSRLRKSMTDSGKAIFYDDELFNHKNYIEHVQDRLDNKTLLLNYFIGKNDLFIFHLSSRKADIVKVPLSGNFEVRFRQFLQKLYTIQDGLRFDADKEGNELYNELIKPVNNASEFKRWIIVPDEYLYYLPFDALSSNGKRDGYLLLNHFISYHYSFSLWLSGNKLKRNNDKNGEMLAFAPFAFVRSGNAAGGLQNLPFSGQEIEITNAKKYLRHDATKETFLKTYEKFSYIHLATHANLSNDSTHSWIMFYPENNGAASGKLFLHEIYNLNLYGTKLVTLSACQTAAGETVSGEGLISLSRAFLFAGAKGIISTLYKTDDKVTALIMSRMYAYLQKGYSIDEALQKSKIDFIHSPEVNPKLKSANFWANFIYVGASDEFTPQKKNRLFIILIPLTIFVLGLLFFKSFRKLL